MTSKKETAGLTELREIVLSLNQKLIEQKIRTDRVVQVLLNNLPEKNLNKIINFAGFDCHGEYRAMDWGAHTLHDFLNEVIDP